MRMSFQTGMFVSQLIFMLALATVPAIDVDAQEPVVTPVNIFGDGDPDNGIEDSRQQMLNGRTGGEGLSDQRMNAGTIKCDGAVRGTAMVLDTREFAPDLEGAVLASAAHVLYDLDNNKRFKRCEFHFLALDELARYRAKIDMKNISMGDFDPQAATSGLAFGEGDWVFLYVARPWKNFDADEAIVAREFIFEDQHAFRQSGGEIRLIAFDSDEDVISVSRNCAVFESTPADLGGGEWRGQLLDNCDSAGGASGGGLVAVLNGEQSLIGIRSGSHWGEQAYPAEQFPTGPPDGALWNRQTNTNFGRAIDAGLMLELRRFSRSLEKSRKTL